MSDISLSSLGAKVVVAASSDENHPPENIIDGYVYFPPFTLFSIKCFT